MARYSFTVGTASGSIQTLEIDADSPESARRSLEGKGLYVFGAGGKARAALRPTLPARLSGRVKPRALLVFNQELLALVRAGLPIIVALDLLRERNEQPRFRSALDAVREDVTAGAALSAAMAKHPKLFGPLYTASLHAGEQSGNFTDALSRYVEYQKRILALRQRLQAALIYPLILIGFSLAVIVFLFTVVVPSLTRIYSDMDATLPTATRILIGISGPIQDALPFILVAAAGIGVALWRWRQTQSGKRMVDRWVVALPWFSTLVSGYIFSRFARTLAMMQAGGVSMIPSLENTLETIGNAHVADTLRSAIPRVAAGSSLADALEKTGTVPSLIVELVAVGESSGSLGEMLGHVADLYDSEMDTRLTALAAVIEPAIMAGMGIVVAVIVIALYLPIFSLASAVR